VGRAAITIACPTYRPFVFAAEWSVLQVRDLSVGLRSNGREYAPIVSDVSFDLPPASTTGLFGPSGCGKTTLALALLNLLPRPQYCVEGSVLLKDSDLLSLRERKLERQRGAGISFVFQDPLLALNPVMRAGDQIAEVIRAHRPMRPAALRAEVQTLLKLVGLADPRISTAYPHELSGGERQRVTLAQALACRPPVVVADEPFTALDAPRVVELSNLFLDLRDRMGVSFLIISHSPGVLARTTGETLVMDAGRIVDRGASRQVLPKYVQ
jgi:ABC-type glutathione transport system ATPase component